MMSQVKRKVTPCAALALAAALGLGMLAVPARALGYVNKTAEHSLTITLSTDSLTEYREDLDKVPTEIPVQVFKVAEINVGGTYNVDPTGPFAGFSDELADPAKWKDASYWETAIAQLVRDIYDAGDLVKPEPADGAAGDAVLIPTVKKGAQPKDEFTGWMTRVELTKGNNYEAEVQNAEMGLYLIVPLTTESTYYTYTFTPALVSVPQLSDSEVSGGEENPGTPQTGDGWTYHVTANLKPEREKRVGRLVIEKELAHYNQSLQGAMFVFEITATHPDDQDYSYHRFAALDFTAPGPQSVTIEDIQVGAKVTVTEVYSGASYHLTADAAGTQNVVIPPLDANPDMDGWTDSFWRQNTAEDGTLEAEAFVRFENDYDRHINSGVSAINKYTRNETEGENGSIVSWGRERTNGNATSEP